MLKILLREVIADAKIDDGNHFYSIPILDQFGSKVVKRVKNLLSTKK